ncbi:MAG: type II and III secretion system protein [Planctomycetes bacterium]|nr:type II and III secretion system protein [Planctomycetota bacterium]
MFKSTAKILTAGLIFSIIMSGALSFGNYKTAKITYTISGSMGVSSVVMQGLPGNPVTDTKGHYTVKVDYGWSGKVTPVKKGYNFRPANRKYSNVMDNQTNHVYIAKLKTFTINGKTGQSGVVMNGLPGNPVSDENGYYTATVNYGFSATVTPTKQGSTFEPSSKKYVAVDRDQGNHNYTATIKTFTISGSTTMDGVLMDGLPGNPVTSDGGLYCVTVNYGWSGTVTPKMIGYNFQPTSRQYTKFTDNHINQVYMAKLKTFTISGQVGQSGVTMNGLPGNPVSDKNGYYSATVRYGFRGSVTPTKQGYTFQPASKKYVSANINQGNHNYAAQLKKFIISGSTGIEGVVMQGLPDNPVTNKDGLYIVTVSYGWSGKVTPKIAGHDFQPTDIEYSKVRSNYANQQYSAKIKTLVISGQTGQSGVVMNGLTGNPVTDEDGYYTTTVGYGWNGIVTPTKKGHAFEPANRTYDLVAVNQKYQNFKVDLLSFVISGTVEADSRPLKNASLSTADGEVLGKTNAKGEYSITVDYGFNGAVTPIKDGYTFELVNRMYANVTRNYNYQNYTGTLSTFTISGTMEIGGEFIEDVLMTADNGGNSSVTDYQGRYSIEVPYGWNGKISPTKPGYLFDPSNKAYTNVTSNIEEDDRIRQENEQVSANQKNFDQYTNETQKNKLSNHEFLESYLLDNKVSNEWKDNIVNFTKADNYLAKYIIANSKIADQLPKRVILNAHIVIMKRDDLISFGMENDKDAKWHGGIQLSYTTDEKAANLQESSLNLLEQNGDATITSSPQVLALDGKRTKIRIDMEGNYSLTHVESQEKKYGTVLYITPHAQLNGEISLEVDVEVDDVVVTPDGHPIVIQRTISDTMRIKDGGMISIARLKNNIASTAEPSEVMVIFIRANTISDLDKNWPPASQRQPLLAAKQLLLEQRELWDRP